MAPSGSIPPPGPSGLYSTDGEHSALLTALAAVVPADVVAQVAKDFDAEIGPMLEDPEFQYWNLWGVLFSSAMIGQPGAIGLLHIFLMTPRKEPTCQEC